MNRQKLALCLLLLVLAGSIVFSFLRSPKQERVAELKYRPGVAASTPRKGAPATAAKATGKSQLHLALLEREMPRFSGFKRNIFSPIFKEEVKLPPFKPLPPPPKPVVAPPPLPPVAAQPPPQPLPTADEVDAQQMAKFTFLGFMQKGGEKTVFLSKENEIFLAKKGSNLGPNYQVSGLTDDAITIKSMAHGKELVIPLQERKPLRVKR